jgi:hypothetical protein
VPDLGLPAEVITPSQFAELKAMLDADAGKKHSANGAVASSLHRILARHREMVLETVAPAIVSTSTPGDLTDAALAAVNRLHDIVHPRRPGGVYEPERNPGGCDKVFCCAILPEVPAAVEPAIRADERERIAQLALTEASRDLKPRLGRVALRLFASQLRGDLS